MGSRVHREVENKKEEKRVKLNHALFHRTFKVMMKAAIPLSIATTRKHKTRLVLAVG